MEGSQFPPGQGTFRKIGVQFWRKVDVAGYIPPFFGHGRVKVGVDQSDVSVSRCKYVGTLLCRVLTRVYPVVTFTLFIISTLYVDRGGRRKSGRTAWQIIFGYLASRGTGEPPHLTLGRGITRYTKGVVGLWPRG